MSLPFLKNNEENPENFWTLVLGKNWVDSAIWRVVGEKAEIVSHGGAFPYQEGDKTSLIEAADGSLSNAASHLPEGSPEPKKVVFGLPPAYLEGGEIKSDTVEILKVLSKELELAPAGFVVIPEAIVHLLKSQEGAPPNVILVGSSEDFLEVTLVQNGKVLGTTEVGRSISTGTDLQEGLTRLPKVEQYPTRILVYNHKAADIQSTKDNLLETDWEKAEGLSFLHTPKVEVLPEDVVARAISLAGGAEVGNATMLAGKSAAVEESDVEPAKIDEEEVAEITEVTKDQNVKTVSAEEFGFKEGEDAQEREFAVPPVSVPQVPAPKPLAQLSRLFSKIKIPTLSSRGSFGSRRSLLPLLLTLVILGSGLAYWFLPEAKVAIYVSPKKYEKELNIKPKTLSARHLEANVTISKSKDTTGSALVGDVAKGEVTIYRVGAQTTLPKGTLLSSGILKFTLDKDVKVASGSAGPDSLGKNTESAPITASAIGTDSNLSVGTAFKIGTLSSETMTAKNEKALTGGVSREVQAVSKDDISKLADEAKKELESQAQSSLKNQLKDGEILIAQEEGIVVTEEDYSAKVGNEAQSLSVKMTGKVKFFAVSKSHIKELLEKEGGLPDGFTLKEDQIQISSVPQGKGEYEVKITANLLPQVDSQDLTKRITGKSLPDARNILSTTPGFVRAEIKIKFKFPGPLGTLPRQGKNISVEVIAK